MTRIPAVLLVGLLLVAAPVAAYAGAPSPPAPTDGSGAAATGSGANDLATPDATAEQSVNWIVIDSSDSVSGTESTSADLGSTLRTGDEQLESKVAERALLQRYGDASSDDEKRRLLVEQRDDINAEIERLIEHEQRAVRAYANGEATERQLLQTLARLNGEAASLESQVRQVQALDPYANSDDSISIRETNRKIQRFKTPLRDDIAEAIRAEAPSTDPIRVTTDQNTLVLEQIEGDQYYREAVQYDENIVSGGNEFEDLPDVVERAQELYPTIGDDIGVARYDTMSYANVDRPYRQTTMYFDSSSRNVFHEHHTFALQSLPTRATVTSTNQEANLAISAERVTNSGPILVNVTDSETGAPLDASVVVEGEMAGRTGDDGELWVTAPDRTATITATVDGADVDITVRDPR